MARSKITDVIGATLAGVSKSDTSSGREQIAYISRTAMIADEKNFYSMDAIDELAANIETVGLLDPLRVRPVEGEDGLYRIVSGHRRRAALDKLAQAGSKDFEQVPVIIERDEASPELQELRLIYANADTRRMSSADLATQAARVTELLYKLKEQGYQFPGRMRDHVAEACKISRTKLATLKVITDNLADCWREDWRKGTLNESCAHALAQAPTEVQEAAYRALDEKGHYLALWLIMDLLGRAIPNEAKRFGCGTCSHVEERMRCGDMHCNGYCCKDCPVLTRCEHFCHKADTERMEALAKEQTAAEERERKVQEYKEAEKTRAEKQRAQAALHWNRLRIAVLASGVLVEDVARTFLFGPDSNQTPDADDIYDFRASIFKKANYKPKSCYFNPEESPYINLETFDFEQVVDLLGCSADFLLGRSPVREIATEAQA